MREEILAGLRNAVARGQTPEQAAQSFINAGYNPQEVKAAYDMLTSGAGMVIGNASAASGQGIQIQQNTKQAIGYQQQPQPPQSAAPVAPPGNPPEKKKGSNTALLITMIVIATLIFLGALGYLFYVLYMNN
ncbi:MAG: hypothetical protein KKD18_03025 [Nanoarchaeota archaeon]|nr:hypothetical protein [Nanoarchaeota archaeon]MBU0977363.1 hypothetical protein [Nanoarchaeota archaeon]